MAHDLKRTAPAVKVTPDFEVGETIRCRASKLTFEVEKIFEGGLLLCKGRAGLMPAKAAEKILPPG